MMPKTELSFDAASSEDMRFLMYGGFNQRGADNKE
jgi:hypothetical protein